jgi:hypothetical protein
VAVPDVAQPPVDDLGLCGLNTVSRWLRAQAKTLIVGSVVSTSWWNGSPKVDRASDHLSHASHDWPVPAQ